ncbi:hypothetical protein [Streptomyces sp. NPDC051776]|uniref:hypothetical protein n=1 Tax=Streptomyces sp. NPDC051776 TaxID=3155414 RepID=UPI00344A6ECD
MQDRTLSPDLRIRWAGVALVAVERKGKAGGLDPLASLAEETSIRSYVISRLGRVDDGSPRDLGLLCRRVIEALGPDRTEASRAAARWRQAERAEILRLRRIKNVLTPLTYVVGELEEHDPLRAEVDGWLALLPHLP